MKKLNILLIDDELEFKENLELLIKKFNIPGVAINGYCSSVTEAVNILLENSFDATIFDIELGMTETCFNIFPLVPRKNIGEVVFSSRFGMKYFTDVMGTNMKERIIAYIDKPADVPQIQNMIRLVNEAIESKQGEPFIQLYTEERRVTVLLSKIFLIATGRSNKKAPLCFYLKDDGSLGDAFSLGRLEDQFKLLDERFFQCSRKSIINLDYSNETSILGDNIVVHFPHKITAEISRGFKDAFRTKKNIRSL